MRVSRLTPRQTMNRSIIYASRTCNSGEKAQDTLLHESRAGSGGFAISEAIREDVFLRGRQAFPPPPISRIVFRDDLRLWKKAPGKEPSGKEPLLFARNEFRRGIDEILIVAHSPGEGITSAVAQVKSDRRGFRCESFRTRAAAAGNYANRICRENREPATHVPSACRRVLC